MILLNRPCQTHAQGQMNNAKEEGGLKRCNAYPEPVTFQVIQVIQVVTGKTRLVKR